MVGCSIAALVNNIVTIGIASAESAVIIVLIVIGSKKLLNF